MWEALLERMVPPLDQSLASWMIACGIYLADPKYITGFSKKRGHKCSTLIYDQFSARSMSSSDVGCLHPGTRIGCLNGYSLYILGEVIYKSEQISVFAWRQ
jgi:hypothetical protein